MSLFWNHKGYYCVVEKQVLNVVFSDVNFELDLNVYNRNLLYERFKPVLSKKSPLNLCSCVVNSQRLFCSRKKNGLKRRIKAFWYLYLITKLYLFFYQMIF